MFTKSIKAIGSVIAVLAMGAIFYYSAQKNADGLNKPKEEDVITVGKPVEVKPVVAPTREPSVSVPRNPLYECKKPFVKYDKWDCRWEQFLVEAIKSDSPLLKLNPDRKYWFAFFRAMAKAESGMKLDTRYVERGLGKDAVTKRQNTSEGLLQVSYQDSKYHGCDFDWEKDKHLHLGDKDLYKTIFQPKNNLQCGVIILEKQLVKRGKLYTKGKPYYWSVLDRKRSGYRRFRSHFSKVVPIYFPKQK